MEYSIRKAREEDLDRILEIYAGARDFMRRTGNPSQWGQEHPLPELTRADIRAGDLYVITEGEKLHGVFFFKLGDDPTYAEIFGGAWHDQGPYGVIHRIAGDGSGGIVKTAVAFARRKTDYLRIDTHQDNKVMQHTLEKNGFRYCGVIRLADGDPRVAYDLKD